jgi:hypothetical protein
MNIQIKSLTEVFINGENHGALCDSCANSPLSTAYIQAALVEFVAAKESEIQSANAELTQAKADLAANQQRQDKVIEQAGAAIAAASEKIKALSDLVAFAAQNKIEREKLAAAAELAKLEAQKAELLLKIQS